jgi:hypothetical protein
MNSSAVIEDSPKPDEAAGPDITPNKSYRGPSKLLTVLSEYCERKSLEESKLGKR